MKNFRVHPTHWLISTQATPRIKVDAVGRHGGSNVEVRLHGNTYDEAAAEAKRLVDEEGLTLVHPFDDPLVIAGQGSVGAEILRQRNGRRLDAIFCCCGGGGLLAGVAAYVKQVRPDVKVYGVEAEDAAGMTASLEAGKPVVLDHVGLFADGAAVKAIGQETFKLCDRYVDGMITVDNDEICARAASFTRRWRLSSTRRVDGVDGSPVASRRRRDQAGLRGHEMCFRTSRSTRIGRPEEARLPPGK